MEFSFASASVTAIRAALDEHGVVLLRDVVPLDLVKRYRVALDDIYTRYDAGDSRFGEFAPDEVKAVEQGDISPRIFKRFSGVTLDEYFAAPKLAKLVELYLSKPSPCQQTFMSVSPTAGKATQGFNMHTDGIILGTDEAVLAFWSPLHDCGSDAPGLRVMPVGREKVLHYLQRKFPSRSLPGWCSPTEWESTNAFETAALESEFGPAWAPVMRPGDVMIFSNWTIHGSYVTAGMTQRRSAVILRWAAKSWGAPPAWPGRILYNYRLRQVRKLSSISA